MHGIKLRLALILAVAAIAIAGCSGLRIAYNSADFFVERYADDYLGLDGTQIERWSPTLDAALARHRKEELPYLAAFFDRASKAARKGFTQADVDCLLDQFETLYQRQFRLAAETAAPLLAGLDKRQIDALERTFRDEAKDDKVDSDPAGIAKRERKRAERYEKNMQWWIGDLSGEQRKVVRAVTRSMPDTAAAWYDYRNAKRRELIKLLRRGAGQTEVGAFLTAWLVDYRDLPASLRQARPLLRQRISELFLRLDPTFSAAQRDQFVGRLTSLRDDFMGLQKRPRMAPIGC